MSYFEFITIYLNYIFSLLGALLNVSMLPVDVVGATPFMKGLKGRLEVHLKVNHDNNTLTLGLTAKACVNSTCIFNKPVFNRTEIPGNIIVVGKEKNIIPYYDVFIKITGNKCKMFTVIQDCQRCFGK